MDKKASVKWKGSLQNGQGWVSTETGALKEAPYSFATRFEKSKGTNPEELIAAAHASCFTMAVCASLTKGGWDPEELSTMATVSIEKDGDSWKVSKSHLELTAIVPRLSENQFNKIAQEAKSNCPISKLLNAEITLDARLNATAASDESRPAEV